MPQIGKSVSLPALNLPSRDEEPHTAERVGCRRPEAAEVANSDRPLRPRAASAGPAWRDADAALVAPRTVCPQAHAITPREMLVADLRTAHALSQAEQWPHRLNDWGAATALGDGVVLERGGRLAGTGMRWRWGDEHATVGLVIVHKDFRRQGLGRQLMQQLLAPLDQRSVLLHATVAGLRMYRTLGFEPVGKISQHQGEVLACPAVELKPGMQLSSAVPADLEALVALDARGAGMPRRAAMEQLLKLGEAVVLRQGDRPLGFAVRRPFGRGLVVGPVAAGNLADARALIGHWLRASVQEFGKPFVRLDVHAGFGLEGWLAGLNLRHVGGAVAMVRGAPPKRGPDAGGWALISQSLG